jgi:transposase InsO family protein
MPAATPRRPSEVCVTIAIGKVRRRVYIRADRNAAAAFRQFVEGFHREHRHALLDNDGPEAEALPAAGDAPHGER